MVDAETTLAQIGGVDAPVSDLIRAAQRRLDHALAEAVAAYGLTLGEWLLLRALNDAGAVAPSLLADRLSLTRGGVTKLIDRLRTRRLVVRAAAGRADRRYQTIALTGAGAVLVRDVAAMVVEEEERALIRLAPADRASLARLLASLT